MTLHRGNLGAAPSPPLAAPDAPRLDRARSSPSGSRSAPGRSGTTSSGCARLGYPVHATRGADRRLSARGRRQRCRRCCSTTRRPSRVAIGLRTAAGGAVTGIEETSLRALAKLEQVLPAAAAQPGQRAPDVTPCSSPSGPGPTVDPEVPDDARRGLPRPARGCASTTTTGAAAPSQRRGRAASARQRRPALVPRRLGHGSGRLADLPRGPARGRTCPLGAAVHAATAVRRGRRGPRRRVASRRPPAATRRGSLVHAPAAAIAERDRAVGRDGGGRRRRPLHPRHRRRQPRDARRSTSACSTSDFTVTEPARARARPARPRYAPPPPHVPDGSTVRRSVRAGSCSGGAPRWTPTCWSDRGRRHQAIRTSNSAPMGPIFGCRASSCR